MKVIKGVYPAQKGIYKVTVKGTSKWSEFDTCRLQISVGHGDKHEGEKFAASLNWAKDRFNKVVICVNDTLQRFNLMNKGLNEKTAYAMAYETGNKWIANNIKEQDSKLEIIRWDYWLKHQDFHHYNNIIFNFYNKDHQFKEGLDGTIYRFFTSKGLKLDEHSQKHSIDYILEELAVFPLMAKQHNAVDVYPGSPPPEFEQLRDGKVKGIDNLANICFTNINFLKNTK